MSQRNTTTRDKHRAVIARGKPPCHICELPIDYKLPHLDPMSYEVDHVMPLNKGGTDTLDNKAASHRHCNREKWDKTPEEMHALSAPRSFVTARSW